MSVVNWATPYRPGGPQIYLEPPGPPPVTIGELVDIVKSRVGYSGTGVGRRDESIDSAFARRNTIITSLKALDEGYSSKNYVRKFLRALYPKWRAKVAAIEESKDLTSLSLNEIIKNLKVHEMIIKKASEIDKVKVERKSLALKAKKESSDEECSSSESEDEEYAMAVRDFKKFFKRREYPKPPKDKNQKAFVGCSWSDSGEKDYEKVKNETCLVAQASSEIITKNKRLKATRNNLDKELSILKKVSTLEKNKGVDLECVKFHMLKIKNEKLKDEALKLTKFKKSTHCLNEMLSNQEPSDDKLGLGFNSFEASSSGTKEIKFVKAQKKASSDGVPINMGPPLVCRWPSKQDSGCSKHMTGNRKLFTSYKAYNGGNVNFGSNLRDNIIGKGQICDNKCRVSLSEHDSEITKDVMIIGTKWVFRNKLDENGIVSRNKAMLVAQGYNQQEGIDYDEIYAPIARLESIRILLAYACALDFKIFQMDVKSAFLNGFINDKVYVAQPSGFVDFEKPDHVYKLKKALYGLKQVPKAWPGIMFSVFFCTRFQEAPKTSHLEAVKHIIRYIKGTTHLGLWYPKGTDIETVVYADFDHAGDYVDRKSTNEFAQILDIPCEGACVFTDKWSLDELAYGVPTDGPYQTNPPSLDDIISSIRIDREGQVRRVCHEEEIDVHEYQILTRKIMPTLKPLEEIIRENSFCMWDNRDHILACLCYMLYCVVHSEKFNLAYYMAKLIEWVTKQKRLILPYGMLLTRLFKFVMNENHDLYNESYVLYDRFMNPITAQQERKTRKDNCMRRGRHSTSSSFAFDQPSSSHLNDDDDRNDEGTSRLTILS
nr:copia protein [Tanacetum cinerariifolium]